MPKRSLGKFKFEFPGETEVLFGYIPANYRIYIYIYSLAVLIVSLPASLPRSGAPEFYRLSGNNKLTGSPRLGGLLIIVLRSGPQVRIHHADIVSERPKVCLRRKTKFAYFLTRRFSAGLGEILRLCTVSRNHTERTNTESRARIAVSVRYKKQMKQPEIGSDVFLPSPSSPPPGDVDASFACLRMFYARVDVIGNVYTCK